MYKKHYDDRDSTKKLQLWSLKKKGYIEINNTKKKKKKTHAEERLKALEKILILKEIKR